MEKGKRSAVKKCKNYIFYEIDALHFSLYAKDFGIYEGEIVTIFFHEKGKLS